MAYTFALTGKIKPAVRITARSKWADPQALEYAASQAAIAWQLKMRMLECGWAMLPARTPLGARVLIEAPKRLHASDLDNSVKAVIDAAQGVVFGNDLWVDEISAARRLGPEYRAFLEIGVLENGNEKG